jgi:hypothetical protein
LFIAGRNRWRKRGARRPTSQRLHRRRHAAPANGPRVAPTTRRSWPTPRSKLHLASQRRADLTGIPSLIYDDLNEFYIKIAGAFNMEPISCKADFAIRPTPS